MNINQDYQKGGNGYSSEVDLVVDISKANVAGINAPSGSENISDRGQTMTYSEFMSVLDQVVEAFQ